MKLNAVQTHEEICKWIASSNNEKQLDVLTLFVTDTFSKRFPTDVNKLHSQFIENMLQKIDLKRNEIGIINEGARQRFPCDDVHQMD